MKKFREKLKHLSIDQRIEFFVTIVIIAISILIVFLNFSGIFPFSDSDLLSIVILLLCSTACIGVLRGFDTNIKIKQNISDIHTSIDNISEHLNLGNHKSTKGVILPRNRLDEDRSLDDLWDGATEVRLLAIANTSVLKGNGVQHIKQAVEKGIRFKIVSLDPKSKIVPAYIDSEIVSDTSLPLEDNLKAYKTQCERSNIFRKNVDLKVTDYLIPYSMMIVMQNDEVLKIKVDLYGVAMDYLNRRSFYVTRGDDENIDFYLNQWDIIWNKREKTKMIDISEI